MGGRKQTRKDFSGNLIKISMLEQEIAYAQSQLKEHDTGHIHTAISWMKHRVKDLKNES
jgi:hypothetical protein|tara:strand:+ start:18 stop:194 length:177 start_codon:yes stop_codon:yes gene_type:complete